MDRSFRDFCRLINMKIEYKFYEIGKNIADLFLFLSLQNYIKYNGIRKIHKCFIFLYFVIKFKFRE